MNSLTMFFKKFTYPSLLNYLLISIISYFILFFIYEPITLGLDIEDMSVLGIPIILGLFLFQYFIKHTIFHRSLLGHGIIALLWALTFPLLFHWSYTKPFYFYEFANDYLFGLFYFIGISLLHYNLVSTQRFIKSISFILALIDWLLSIIPLAQIGYYVSIWHCLTPSSLMALYMTNPEESFGFLKNTAGIPGLIGLTILLIVFLYFLYWCNLRMPQLVAKCEFTQKRKFISLLLVLIGLVYIPFIQFPKTCIISSWNEITAYMKELQTYDIKHEEIFKNLTLKTQETTAKKLPGTIIMVIGESSSRDYMKVYNHNFPYDDTPWMDKTSNDKNFIFFNHAYSSYVQTVPTLERALTERNQYDDKPFIDSVNIIDVAKKAGYTTSWLSNQGVYGEYDTAISLVAKTADRAQWSHESYMFSDKYDEEILPLLKATDKDMNNFIVIHIMGSHIYYNDRYPHEFSKWRKGEIPDGIEAYANSQLYTDWLLQNIYEYAKDNLNLQAMVYFSDHGESIKLSHNPDNFDFTMTRIPLWIYLSPQYQATYPSTTEALLQHQHQFFTNDLIYDLMTGIIHAPSDNYDVTRDFSNDAYRFNRNNLTTMLGTEPLSKDPLGNQDDVPIE